MIQDIEHHIRERAHSIWEREGRPAGRAEAHWGMAHAELATAAAPAVKAKAPRKAAAATAAAAPKRRSATTKAVKTT